MKFRRPVPSSPSAASSAFSGAAEALRAKIRACAARNFAAQQDPAADAVMADYQTGRGERREGLGGKAPEAGRC